MDSSLTEVANTRLCCWQEEFSSRNRNNELIWINAPFSDISWCCAGGGFLLLYLSHSDYQRCWRAGLSNRAVLFSSCPSLKYLSFGEQLSVCPDVIKHMLRVHWCDKTLAQCAQGFQSRVARLQLCAPWESQEWGMGTGPAMALPCPAHAQGSPTAAQGSPGPALCAVLMEHPCFLPY